MTYTFRLLKTPNGIDEGDFNLICSDLSLGETVNKFVGKKVLKEVGSGEGKNFLINDKDAWSDYISFHVVDVGNNEYNLTLPNKKTKRV